MTTKHGAPAQRLAYDRRALAGMVATMLAGALLGACGRKGDLERPPKPKDGDKGASQ